LKKIYEETEPESKTDKWINNILSIFELEDYLSAPRDLYDLFFGENEELENEILDFFHIT
jgi:hypothetical protein